MTKQIKLKTTDSFLVGKFIPVSQFIFSLLIDKPGALQVYLLMNQRFSISRLNKAFLDNEQIPFIYLSQVEASEILHCSRTTTNKNFNVLKNLNIIKLEPETSTGKTKVYFVDELEIVELLKTRNVFTKKMQTFRDFNMDAIIKNLADI